MFDVVRLCVTKLLVFWTFVCLPQKLFVNQEFNAGLFDYLIATDIGQTGKDQEDSVKKPEGKNSRKRKKPKLDAEFGVVRGIDFKNVLTVRKNYSSICD